MPGWPDAAIAEIADRQRALVTRQQLRALGLSSSAIGRATVRGRLHRVHRGVYALVPQRALAELAREQAAVLACGENAVLSHASAAFVWGLAAWSPGPVTVSVPGAGQAGRTRPGIDVHRVTTLIRRDLRRHRGLPVTSPARTLLDRAGELTAGGLQRALDEALHRRLTSRTALREMLDAHPGRPGGTALRELIDPRRPTMFTRADSERRMLALLRRGGVALPETNVLMDGLEADFVWRAQRVIVEVDGWDTHGTRAAFQRDRRRDADLGNRGWRVIRITWEQLTREPESVLVIVATALALAR